MARFFELRGENSEFISSQNYIDIWSVQRPQQQTGFQTIVAEFEQVFHDATMADDILVEHETLAVEMIVFGLSRIKRLIHICVLQAFSPRLFIRGPPTGPDRLIRRLSKKITFVEASDEWMEDHCREQHEEEATNPMTATHLCTSCYLLGKESYMLPLKQFGVKKAGDFFMLYLSQGQWTMCLQCQQRSGVHPQHTSRDTYHA